jgi:hypothetical protein
MFNGQVWVVITTINPPRSKVKEFLELGWCVVIVADLKTPHDEWGSFFAEGLHFFSLEDQYRKYPVLSKLIGENTYARKNLGYLFATEKGAEIIFDTDDDTFLRSSTLEIVTGRQPFEHFLVTGEGWFNPYVTFAPGSGLWPRGYPLTEVALDRRRPNPNLRIEKVGVTQPEILQTLVNLEPDVDSIFRMTVTNEILEFPASKTLLHIDWPVITPANTQSTFWFNRSLFTYLYIPTTVSFRFTDILKMFIAQSKIRISYAGFLTDQIRNPHDLMKDFASEIECFIHTSQVTELLRNNTFSSLIDVYLSLSSKNICKIREIEIASEFMLKMEQLINA